MTTNAWIDVHTHYTRPADGAPLDLSDRRDHMSKLGVGMQMLSDLSVFDARSVRLTNDYGAEAVARDPEHFGLLAALPVGDPAAAIDEVARAAQELNADGFAVCATYDGDYLGAERFRPVWAALNELGATVFIHPSPFEPGALPLPPALFEVTFDTARTVVDLIWNGILRDNTNLRIVLAHAGGALPTLAGRLEFLCDADWVPHEGVTPRDIRDTLNRIYYDTAMSAPATSLHPVLGVTTPDHIVYGSDFAAPCASESILQANIDLLRDNAALPSGVGGNVGSHAQPLFPRAAARMEAAVS